MSQRAGKSPPSVGASRLANSIQSVIGKAGGDLLIAASVAVSGILSIAFWTVTLRMVAVQSVGEVTPVYSIAISNVSVGLGGLLTAVVYFTLSDDEWAYIDVSVPRLSQAKDGLFALLAVVLGVYAVGEVSRYAGVESASHSLVDTVAESGNPEILLWLAVLAFLVVGPAEELVYRNIVQKRLYTNFSGGTAVVVSSMMFALVHFPSYLNGTGGQTLSSLATIFVVALPLGWVFLKTSNLFYPTAVHGAYNAFVYYSLYATAAG